MHRLLAAASFAIPLNLVPHVAHAQAPATRSLVSTAWVQERLTDPKVRVVATGSRATYDLGHIPGATFVEHDDTLDMAAGRHQSVQPTYHSLMGLTETRTAAASASCIVLRKTARWTCAIEAAPSGMGSNSTKISSMVHAV